MLNEEDNQHLNEIVKHSFKQYEDTDKSVDELAEMLNIDKSMINVTKLTGFDTIMSIGDQSVSYLYSFKGSMAVKIMLQYALDNNNINIIRPLIQTLIDDMKEIPND
jgi:predicted transcriptional regulator